MRKQIADQCSTLSAGTELPQRFEQNALLIGQAPTNTHRLAIRFEQLGLVVKRVHVRHATVGENEDNAFGFGRVVRRTRGQWVRRSLFTQQFGNDARQQYRSAHQAAQHLSTWHQVVHECF